MKRKTLVQICFISLPIILAVLVLRPVPIVKENQCLVSKGVVVRLFESGVKDVSIVLKDDKRWYYINRGLENGLNLTVLNKKILGKEVILKYPDYWTPLDWDGSHKHVSKLEFEGEVLFDETLK